MKSVRRMPIVPTAPANIIQCRSTHWLEMKNNQFIVYNLILLEVKFVLMFYTPSMYSSNNFIPKDLNVLSMDYSIRIASPRDPEFSVSSYEDEANNYINPIYYPVIENKENDIDRYGTFSVGSHNRLNARTAKAHTSGENLQNFNDATSFPEYTVLSLSGDANNPQIGYGTINPVSNLLESTLDAFQNGYALPQTGFGEISLRYSSPTSRVGTVTTNYEVPQSDYWIPSVILPGDTLLENHDPQHFIGEVLNSDFNPSTHEDLMFIEDSWNAVPAPYYGYDDTFEYVQTNNDLVNNLSEMPTSLYEVHGLPDPDPQYQMSQPDYTYSPPQADYSNAYVTPYENAIPGTYQGNYVGQTTNEYGTPYDDYLAEYSNYNVQSMSYNPSIGKDKTSDWLLPTVMSLGVRLNDYLTFYSNFCF